MSFVVSSKPSVSITDMVLYVGILIVIIGIPLIIKKIKNKNNGGE